MSGCEQYVVGEDDGDADGTELGLADGSGVGAPHWSGPYSIVGGPAIPFQQEDFYMYKTKRGFHAVFHGM